MIVLVHSLWCVSYSQTAETHAQITLSRFVSIDEWIRGAGATRSLTATGFHPDASHPLVVRVRPACVVSSPYAFYLHRGVSVSGLRVLGGAYGSRVRVLRSACCGGRWVQLLCCCCEVLHACGVPRMQMFRCIALPALWWCGLLSDQRTYRRG